MNAPGARPAWRTLLVAGAFAVLVATVTISPPKRASTTQVVLAQEGVQRTDPTAGPADSADPARPAAPGRSLPPAPPGISCAAGRNGGPTDTGVTGDSITIGATVVDSGIGASFLRDARFSLLAVKNKVNRAGGICGRKIDLILVDDGWSFARGGQFLKNLVEDRKVFALGVVPSSEGLKNVSDSGYLKRKGVPVVGTDGMLIHQYTDPYIWPVAASTISAMHIMAKQAYDAGARSFGIVYEHNYHFGIEGAYAFNAAVKRLTGSDIPGYANPLKVKRCDRQFCGIKGGQSAYGTEIETFNSACFNECDFVALLLEPATALTWMTGGAVSPSDGIRMGAPPPLFTRTFAEECKARCDKLWVWTSYDPPIGGNLGRPAVAQYVEDIKVTSSAADPNNTFAQGAYIGMSLLVEALQRTGPLLTRERLVATLDAMTFESGLTSPLTWRAGRHFANTRMQAFSIQFRDRFAGWADQRIAMTDPWVGMDIPS